MKILYLAPDTVPSPKGASVRILRTVDTFRALGHEVELCTPRNPDPAENLLRRMMRFRNQAREWLRDRDADVVQFRGIWEGIPALDWARARRAVAVYEAHGFPSIELRYHFPRLAPDASVLRKIIEEEQRVLTGSDRVVTPSRTGERFLLMRGVARDRISVVPNVVDTDLFSPPSVPPPDQPPLRLVYQGTLSPWQGLGTLLEALVPFRNQNRFEVHIVGPGKSEWRRAVRQELRRRRVHHFVFLAGAMEQRDLAPVLRSAHVCLAPLPADARNAVQGCCPIKLLEYMAVGRPILSTRIDPVEEILTHGENAHLVRPGSPAALTEGLAWMLDHPEEREEMGRRARLRALEKWTPRRFERDYAEFLGDLPLPARRVLYI